MPHFYTDSEQQEIDAHFPECPNISVDYAILEHSDEIYVFPADFGWSDLGTWGSLHEQLPHDRYNNATVGTDVRLIEAHDNVVHTSSLRQVVVQGLEDCIVAEHDGVLLICKRSEEQRIRLFHD
jgi:mannose-1-phosphate guanylyltransferase